MQITEFECKKCKYSFTRLYKDKKEAKALKEKCIKCGGEVKKLQEIELGQSNGGCSSCEGCSSRCNK
uniref:Zinc ribbon domain-containing protein n=1 Tax=candidate division CPR3 bacterium TaxID=2268181 RepID=A0A7C4R838_UNCC3